MRNSQRRAIAVLATAAAAGLLAGCTLISPTRTQTESEVPIPAGLESYYQQELEWSPCEPEGRECSTVTAPIDYENPGDGDIELAVVRVATDSDDRVGSLLMNPGGPGGSGVELVQQAAEYVTSDALRESFDIVGWDPRGVGLSTPVQCYDDADMDAFLYSVPANPTGSDAWLAEQVDREKAFADACLENTGPLLGFIDVESNARDMDLLRAVLGDKKLTYLGFSYGTSFGAHYAELFPENAGRLVLDGAIDPSLESPETFTVQMAGFENAYRAFVEDCLLTSACPFTGTVDTALAQSKTLFDGVEARELRSDDGRQLTASTLGTALSYPLYDEGSWPALSQMISELEEGDATLALQLADGYNSRNDDGTYADQATAVYTAATCLDGQFTGGLDGTRATLDAIDAAAPTIGAFVSYADWAHISIACQNWPFPSSIEAHAITADGAAPILVLGTTNDPATPYTWAEAMASQLDSGVLITREGEGHTAYAQGNACIDETVDDYLVDGLVPVTDPLC
ncbi:pimeloyl-ACP methyl ester carboxylesterase [Conyzicola lurida]|uniref:Pimeloyl-ACP methyl ester carboxylesterase n=1 Tax=Conyzicola lurida TaxID=1172621 RepID=A0A841AHL5_9MICO|nr:alpha/beta hydrolase [Conyzicola lurida]MBB5841904.1 pimeloyl-ACP methyl ester carboxylesterase [Conyzicola lurida]